MIEISKWPKNYDFVVLFMVDDLANISFFRSNGELSPRMDWGFHAFHRSGIWSFLCDKLLNEYPEIKFTFFLVTGKRSPQVEGTSYPICYSCNDTSEFKAFLDFLISCGHEIAYHGTTHGIPTKSGMLQEWECYSSFEEAVNTINKGIHLYVSAIGNRPLGGKYCGYAPGKYGLKSIESCGFDWWCDKWDDDVTSRVSGEFYNDIILLPSNLDPSQYSIFHFKKVFRLKFWKSIYKNIKRGSNKSRLKQIISNRGIVSIQEHISPLRTDGKTQYPNLYDDIDSLKSMMKEISKYNPWYATANEISEYIRLRESILIEMLDDLNFTMKGKLPRVNGLITILILDSSYKYVSSDDIRWDINYEGRVGFVELPVIIDRVYRLEM